MKIAEKISFVAFDRDFLQKSFFWLSDSEIQRLTDTPSISRDGQERWFQSLPTKKDYYIKGILADNHPIGAAGIKNITAFEGEYWGYIGEKQYWGQGIGKLMVGEMIHHAIHVLHLGTLFLHVLPDNKRAIGLYQRMGFTVDKLERKNLKMSFRISQ